MLRDLPASVTVQKSRCLDELLSISTPLAFERVVRITLCGLVELEELPQIVDREMSLGVFSGVYYTSGQVLFRASVRGVYPSEHDLCTKHVMLALTASGKSFLRSSP